VYALSIERKLMIVNSLKHSDVAMIKSALLKFGVAIWIILMSACSESGNDESNLNNQQSMLYEPLTETIANQKFSDMQSPIETRQVLHDGLGNSLHGVADLNIVIMARNANGDLLLAYDAYIYHLSYTEDFSADTWIGTVVFNLYIDNDNNPSTGYSIGDLGAEIKLSNSAQYIWDAKTSEWISTWFESSPPPLGLHIYKQSASTISDLKKPSEGYTRIYTVIPYLDTLTIDPNAKSILQVPYDITGPSGFPITTTLDETQSFDMPNF